MELHKLLFELSSTERINILQEFQKQRLKLSHVSRRLDLTVTEASRHLQRLAGARLIDKNSDGLYGLTPYGHLALSQLSGLDFITKHQNYFMEYDVSCLPYEFIDRIGELSNGQYGGDIFGNIELAENEFRKANQFIYVLSDQILKSLIPTMLEKLKDPIDVRFIFPETVMPPDNMAPIPSTTRGVQKRVLPKVEVIVIVTDQLAGFCLPNRMGKIDYRNFHGNEPKFSKWCKDLFLHYWNKAKPFGPF